MDLINARFYVWEQGPVKITLRPGQRLTWARAALTEEGWSRTSTTWLHTGDAVVQTSYSEGCDCDGRTSDERTSICPVDKLQSGVAMDGVRYPRWTLESDYCRDYAAEAAGY